MASSLWLVESHLPLRALWLSALVITAASPVVAQQNFELLFVGTILGERTWPKTGETWLGLYSTSSGYQLAATPIRVEQVPDACAGTATKVSAETAAEPYLLVRGPGFEPDQLDTAFVGREFLYPGQSKSVKLGEPDKWYYLRALGTADVRRGEILFTNYRLELSGSGRNEARVQAVLQLKALTLDNTPQIL